MPCEKCVPWQKSRRCCWRWLMCPLSLRQKSIKNELLPTFLPTNLQKCYLTDDAVVRQRQHQQYDRNHIECIFSHSQKSAGRDLFVATFFRSRNSDGNVTDSFTEIEYLFSCRCSWVFVTLFQLMLVHISLTWKKEQNDFLLLNI